jgi:DNA-binding SARP family transcriptional activator
LALLALRGTGVHRTVAGECLWRDGIPERAAANLRSALWRDKRLGNTTMIESVGPRLWLAPTVEVDLRQILDQRGDLAHLGLPCHSINERLALVDALTRRLLPEWSEDWLVLERAWWEEFRLHENIAGQLLAKGRYVGALRTVLAATSIEPVRETAHRIVIEVHLAEGNTASAVKYYHRYRELLRRELGVVPSTRLDQLVQGLTESTTTEATATAMSLCSQTRRSGIQP